LCANVRKVYVLADERKRAGIFSRKRGGDQLGSRARNTGAFRASRALLPELFGRIKREPLQVELPQVRVLFELLGFLLSVKIFALVVYLTPQESTSTMSRD
jgi:hypothetical protein